MAVLVQPLDRVLPLHPPRRHAASLSHRHPHLHVRRALARPSPRAVGLARGAVHPAGGRRKEDPPSLVRVCLKKHRGHCSCFSSCAVWRQMVVPPRVCGRLGVGRQFGRVRSWRRQRAVLCVGARRQLGGYVL
jgi:hypothetical protein